MNWDDAVSYCRDLKLDGHPDWRLPTVRELASIYNGGDGKEGLNIKGGISLDDWAWSSDPADPSESAVYYNFAGTAFSNAISKGNLIRVLCVLDMVRRANPPQAKVISSSAPSAHAAEPDKSAAAAIIFEASLVR